ncbi:hypothetical protein Tco_0878478 [Tanacetum coccineum]|uniref:Uncharacterized protein n=1 Tax=Tanacetum coccineum TaxID=301880 RepID=A0ABQ5C0Y8_9ASTR
MVRRSASLSLSEIQLDHEKVDRLVVKVVHGCRMVVKEIEDGFVKEIDLEWWFAQDIDDGGEEDEEDEDGSEV